VVPDLLTLKEAAAELRISKTHMGRLAAGAVPGVPPIVCVRLGRRVLVRRERLAEWVEQCERGAMEMAEQ
jgi:hypothetical protein